MGMKSLGVAAISFLMVAGLVEPSHAVPVQWVGAGSNGHWYEVIYSPLSWTDASDAASSLSNAVGADWYLATITSQDEQDFIEALLGVPGSQTFGYRLGGFQPVGAAEPSGGWQWVSGEPFTYANWGVGEPNNLGGDENHLYMDDRFSWAWNDFHASATGGFYIKGYIVEHNPVPEPSTVVLLGCGLLGLVGLSRRRRK